MTKIVQSDNYSADFGNCLRSSAIFWYPPPSIARTKIVLSNYWLFKNNIKTLLIASFRNHNGQLLGRQLIDFDASNIYILNAPLGFDLEQGGSVEVEAFGNENLRIPYAAVMAIYETNESLSMVHSYSRIYSPWEIEEERTIQDGHEACWSLKDTKDIYSFAVLHNGGNPQCKQIARLVVKNYDADALTHDIHIPQLSPYETFLIKPVDYIDNIIEFLGGQPGSATLCYKLNGAFTRMLVGWHSLNNGQLQVTHSNFNYAIHETGLINSRKEEFAYMHVPLAPFACQSVVYPDYNPGSYYIQSICDKRNLSRPVSLSGARQIFEGSAFKFWRQDGLLPTRIVTAIEGVSSPTDLGIPCECSLGVVHSKRPPKHFHWGVCHSSFPSRLLIVTYSEIYGEPDELSTLSVKVLVNGKTFEKALIWKDINIKSRASILMSELFPTLMNPEDAQDFGYMTIHSSYGGFMMFTCIQKNNSWALEHTF